MITNSYKIDVGEVFLIDRNKYILEMKALLGFMDTDDRDQVLAHYAREFDRAGAEGEEALIEALGSPLRQVLQVEKLYRARREQGLPIFDEDGAEYAEENEADEAYEDEEYVPYPEEAATDEYEEEQTAEDAPVIPVIVPEESFEDESTEIVSEEAAPEEAVAEESEGPALMEEEDAVFLKELMAATYAADAVSGEEEEAEAAEETAETVCEEESGEAAPAFVLPDIEDFGADNADAGEYEETGEESSDYVDLPSEVLSDAAGEMLSGVDFSSDMPEEADSDEIVRDAAEEEATYEEEAEEKPGAGRVILAVVLTPLFLVAAAACIVLTFALAAIPLALCGIFGASCTYLALYAITSMSYLPDMLTILGVSVALLAFTVLFLWAGIAVLVKGIRLTVRVVSGMYGRVLKKGGR